MIENQLWVESYRPKKIEDCVLIDDIKTVAQGIVEKRAMPNMMLVGSAGTGKTTLAQALCNELEYDFIKINCSNDRGIDLLRTQLVQFASSVSLNSDMKVVILDEADHMTPLLQAGLRNFIEEFHKTTRFVLTANYPGKIIEPLHSRCAVLDFTIKSKDKARMAAEIMKRTIGILDKEGVKYDKKAVAELITKFFPDFRRIINEMQRYASITGVIDTGILGALETLSVKDFVDALRAKSFKKARTWIVENLAVTDQQHIYRSIYDNLADYVEPSSIPTAILLIANYQYRGMTSIDPEVQMSAFAIELMQSLEWKND